MSTAEHLAQYGVTLEQAKDFILSNIAAPNVIYETSLQFGVTAAMLAEIYGGVTKEEVVGFFDAQGLNGSALDAGGSSTTTVLPSGGIFNLNFTLGTSEADQILSGAGSLPSLAVAIGMEGNDQLVANNSTSTVLLGGSGNDTYTLGSSGQYLILDSSGSNDHINMSTSFSELDAELINGGNDLILFDSSLALLLPDWKNPENRIESFSLNGESYTYSHLVAAVNAYGVTIDNFSFNGMDSSSIDKHLKLFDKLALVDSTNAAQELDFDTTQVVGSDSLIDYYML
ncbi:hypothetical protein [Neptunomonas sp.]|uniref:hypothetical protein n=1 Tax=Neptunomonas sp. TaxID=1971898 RepID=UPI0025D1B775|nr:hypothetical protein [Neptunomonas sp.]